MAETWSDPSLVLVLQDTIWISSSGGPTTPFALTLSQSKGTLSGALALTVGSPCHPQKCLHEFMGRSGISEPVLGHSSLHSFPSNHLWGESALQTHWDTTGLQAQDMYIAQCAFFWATANGKQLCTHPGKGHGCYPLRGNHTASLVHLVLSAQWPFPLTHWCCPSIWELHLPPLIFILMGHFRPSKSPQNLPPFLMVLARQAPCVSTRQKSCTVQVPSAGACTAARGLTTKAEGPWRCQSPCYHGDVRKNCEGASRTEGKPADRKGSKESIEKPWAKIDWIMRTQILWEIREQKEEIK